VEVWTLSESNTDPEITADGIRCPLRRDELVSKFCEVIPSTLAAVDAVQDKVLAVVQSLPCAPEELEDVTVALREALANAILHGNKSDPAKRVVVACFCECEENGGLLLVVRDEGPGFNPDEIPDPTNAEAVHSWHGRGM
jgi:serine/threonine-protein kinase RsbW